MDSTIVATWIQAIGSAGSLLAFATWVGIAVLDRKDEHEQRFVRQAQTVAAWLDQGSQHDREDEYVVCVANGGDTPVYRCEIRIQGLFDRGESADVPMYLVPPQSTRCAPVPTSLEGLTWEEVYLSGVAPQLHFTDSSGRRWQRDGDGILSDLSAGRRILRRRSQDGQNHPG